MQQTSSFNMDNISRTEAYANYYKKYPEIKWSFLASMVSRNAGWNMCDLEGEWMSQGINEQQRNILFQTYERANWLIFQDAYPQLLLYEASLQHQTPLFHLLSHFGVSKFMQEQWGEFWKTRDEKMLMHALIVNEQNIIQNPVMKHPFYQKKVFKSFVFQFQDWLHFSSVLFPTTEGELYGCSVHHFWNVSKRIELGKKLAQLLFDPVLYPSFLKFSQKTVHTGSRYDYEQYFHLQKRPTTPILRLTYPIVQHHQSETNEWHVRKGKVERWMKAPIVLKQTHLTNWYQKKEIELHMLILAEQWWRKK
ncbi:DUF2515 domain-containing protein [Priestia koreensis]|uniref:DUF2515 domain-containing protein n=1 Tax=Priestia koreensis TaxID=284581 RepID=UPI0028F6F6C8|nr:DUF2515 domain-containing protein [Priestia koreensis]